MARDVAPAAGGSRPFNTIEMTIIAPTPATHSQGPSCGRTGQYPENISQ